MKNKMLKKIAKGQKYQILREIKRSQGLSVAELCLKIHLSYMGVKQHCVALEREGYLDTWRRPKGMGRPEKAYRLTPMAQDFFPNECTDLTAEILHCVEQIYGPAAPEKILHQIYTNQADRLASKVQGTNLEEKARALAAIRENLGYMSEYYFNPDTQQHQIIEYNSPVVAILDQYKIVVDLERNLFERLLGTKVKREQERVSGLYKCVFVLG